MKFTKFCLILILLFLIGCSSNNDKLIIGLIKPSLDHLPFGFGLEIGTLKAEDYKIRYFSSGWETNEALVSEKIDVAIMPFTYTWTDVSQGKKVKIISFMERESDGIITTKEIKNIQDLDGKKIGVLRASTLDIFAEMFLDENNINMDLVYFRTPMDMATALKSGEVDALSYYVPSIFKFDENFHIIHWFSEKFPFHPCCDLSATEKAISDKKKKITKLIQGLEKSVNGINNNPAIAFDFAQISFYLQKEIAKQSLYHTKFVMGLAETGKLFEQKAVNKMIEKGYIVKPVKAEDVYFEIR
ncbi:MAG TPA: ABC transporter substrate-binding protein [Candidatus Cloacimonetes bacterium]|nr:ABC transporter substrate-binding protein [Candidatus Cloacimonadota bacterium]